jgi:hypothetical protein
MQACAQYLSLHGDAHKNGTQDLVRLNIKIVPYLNTNFCIVNREQLLLILLRITSLILSKTPPRRKEETLGGKLAPAIFQASKLLLKLKMYYIIEHTVNA